MKMLEANFETNSAVQKAYMPFVKNGGLLISTIENFELDEQVEVLVTLPGSPEEYRFTSKVVWIAPSNVAGQGATGVKVHGIGETASPVLGFGSGASSEDVSNAVGVQLSGIASNEIQKILFEHLSRRP